MKGQKIKNNLKKYLKINLGKIRSDPLFFTLFFSVLALGFFFRTYNWFGRIYIHADNALYAQIAKYALDTLRIPQIGVFPQAPFFTGPEWLWVLMIFYLFPLGILVPWYLMTFFSILFIYLIFWVGREIGGKWLGILAAFFTAISTAQIDNSFSVWNTSADPFLIILAIIFLIKFYKTKKTLWMFLIAFTISFAITVRFQMLITIPVIAVALFCHRPRIKYFLAAFIGFVLPLLPFLFFDLRFNWFETGRIYDYAKIGQYRIYVPNRWLTYAGVWWPEMWGLTIGGSKLVGGLLIFLVSIFTLVNLKNFKKNIIYYLSAIAFVLEVILFRYFRGERYVYYSLFAHGTIILLSSFAILGIYKLHKAAGVILIAIISFLTLGQSLKNLEAREISYSKIESFKQEIYKSNNAESYDIYGCNFNGSRIGRALALLIYGDGKNKEGGLKIGVCEEKDGYGWFVLSDEEAANRDSWFAATTSTTHREAIEWWIQNPPK